LLRILRRPKAAVFPVATVQRLRLPVLAFVEGLPAALLPPRLREAAESISASSISSTCRASIFSITDFGTCSKYVPVVFLTASPSPHNTVTVGQTYGENLLLYSHETSELFSAMVHRLARFILLKT
jgi:hypothetical protein